jgi:Nucleotidyl transferase AbiEii toxin, Type IV TA system
VFRRPHHNAVLTALTSFDGDLLQSAECYFGGGTAIVLSLDEYREGYRMLREITWDRGFEGLIKPSMPIKTLRSLRTDQYGIRTIIQPVGIDIPIKFEIVRESRISLSGAVDARLGVPQLARDDMYTEKLLANADRWPDRAVLSRDIIDLSIMISRWGPIPEAAWEKARTAYGVTVAEAYGKAGDHIRDRDELRRCMRELSIDPALLDEILSAHD